ncbi:MAG TPA: hypothetical protein VLZ29_09940 [Sulfurimonas sp.]|uniref:hypothetical protein n=1 Tax=Sulfurimonas sp. TaxID=2022749 RepID=UPI002B561417|nr:hypothetical protein [Sulfurimonas sp.]HUH43429.1 hypothetical protein [Sulfurimonas sp.]
MKTKLLTLTLIISTLAFTGCSKEENVKTSDKWNIEVKELATPYYYEFTEDTEIMCRNFPQWYKKSWTSEEPYPLKNHDNNEREIQTKVFRDNGKKHFGITHESDLGNPIILVVLTNYSTKDNKIRTESIRCEIASPKDELKKEFYK